MDLRFFDTQAKVATTSVIRQPIAIGMYVILPIISNEVISRPQGAMVVWETKILTGPVLFRFYSILTRTVEKKQNTKTKLFSLTNFFVVALVL